MRIKPKFRLGDWVRVKSATSFFYGHNGVRQIEQTLCNIVGQIVGARIRFLGKYEGSVDGGPYLRVRGSIVVWLVADGYLNAPYEAIEENIELIRTVKPSRIYINKTMYQARWRKNKQSWDDKQKAELRKIMQDVPRDANGRWIA